MSDYIEEPGISYTPGKIEIPDTLSVPGLLLQMAERTPKKVAVERKAEVSGQWVKVTFKQFLFEIRQVARGLIASGIKPGDNVAIMAHTSYEWTLFDFAIQFAGARAIPIYETSSTEQAEWIITNSEIVAAVVEDPMMRAILDPVFKKERRFKQTWVISDDAQGKLSRLGETVDDSLPDKLVAAQKADDLWTIIYTSGTTGKPKGVELTHRNVLHVAMNGVTNEELMKILGGKEARTLLFLPMAHVFARFINITVMYGGNVVGYSPNIKNLVADFRSFRPTLVLAVPRVFEKLYNAADAKAGRGLKLKVFRHFAKVAINYSRALDTKEGPSAKLKAQHRLGDRALYGRLREITGGRMHYAISGGAPLGERLGHFFRGAGITVFEGYGLTETSAPTTVNRPGNIAIGSVGQAYPGCYLKIDDDGELLVKGDHVFRAYHNSPKETKEAFTEDGWFRTGDIGRIDENDFVWITGRKKELIVTAGGKNVAPAILEDNLRGHPLISQVVVVGDKKPFIAALITLDAEALPQWLENHELEPMTLSQAITDPQIVAAVDRAVKYANRTVSRAESIRKFVILPGDFTVTNGYLTPSMKVRRANVIADFADEIAGIYGEK
ncbi:long-chain fatty acid--CoA ligase [Arcanobacterium sp. S3PF19]|uniref:AMP-dependent synthetase/ligase n=1 Tax=Arcanobacterium sp. S3PF19 TaxID=1219585 RepID=UPI00050F888C|nr:AMP-dependent synthetase/ligase [Arcanobacterium sp. S3PF19]KGF05517.1 long-chain fatty acid--CoA ligase [Arcanobacterium sp. S3PF19]